MPPDDPILGSGSEATATDATPSDTGGNGADPSPGGGQVSMEQVGQMIAQSNDKLTETLTQQFGQLVEQLRPQQAPPPQQDLNQSEEDFLTQFSQDPRGMIEKIAAQTSAPAVHKIVTGAGSALVDIEAQSIDQEFGGEAFAKHIAPHWNKIQAAYQQSNPIALADRQLIQREMQALIGMQRHALAAHKQEWDKAQSEAETGKVDGLINAVSERVNLTGGLRPVSSSDEPSKEQLANVEGWVQAKVRSIGGSGDAKDWIKEHIWEGDTLEDFKKHQAKIAPKETN